MCSLSPMALLAAAVGITVASVTGSTGAGWAAAAVVAAVVYLVVRRQGGGACRLPQRKVRGFEGLEREEALRPSGPARSDSPGAADGGAPGPAAPGSDAAGRMETAER